MNCLEVRQLILADPARLPQEARLHLQQCQRCYGFAEEMNQLNQDLTQAFRVPVPEELSSRILLRHALEGDQPESSPVKRRGWMMALAASLIVSLSISLWLNLNVTEDKPLLAEAILGHMPHEAAIVEQAHNLTHDKRIDQVLAQINATRQGDLGPVVYATVCIIDGMEMAHLAIEEEGVHYTVMLIPTAAFSAPTWFENDRWQGVAASGAGSTVAILTDVQRQRPPAETRQKLSDMAESYQRLLGYNAASAS